MNFSEGNIKYIFDLKLKMIFNCDKALNKLLRT